LRAARRDAVVEGDTLDVQQRRIVEQVQIEPGDPEAVAERQRQSGLQIVSRQIHRLAVAAGEIGQADRNPVRWRRGHPHRLDIVVSRRAIPIPVQQLAGGVLKGIAAAA
jgi:hypothetical protein